MALNRLEEARSTLQRAVDAKADNLFIHQQLYQLAFLTDDADGMQREMKWAEGKPSEYLLLNEAASAAAAHGQMQKAEELIQRSMQVSDRLGFKETTADTKANWALIQAAVGNVSKARELAAASSSLAQGRSNLVSVAQALAISGDSSRAQSITEELGRRFPNDALLHNVGIPSVCSFDGIESQGSGTGDRGTSRSDALRTWQQPRNVSHLRSRAGLFAGKAWAGGRSGISEDGRSSWNRPNRRGAFAGQTWTRPGICDQRRRGESESRLSGSFCALERCRS